MTEGLSSNLGVRLRSLSWPVTLIAILVVRAAVSLVAKPDSALLSSGSLIYFLLVLLALGYSLWLLDQWIFLYHQFVLHTDVPDNSIADPVLFLHIVPFMAAVANLPTLHVSGPKLYRVLSNFLL